MDDRVDSFTTGIMHPMKLDRDSFRDRIVKDDSSHQIVMT